LLINVCGSFVFTATLGSISISSLKRQDAVDNLRAGKTWVLIATEVIARGMDFKGVNCVINYDFPESASAYIHRIGKYLALTGYTHPSVHFCE
jgi:Lhr-like helicase